MKLFATQSVPMVNSKKLDFLIIASLVVPNVFAVKLNPTTVKMRLRALSTTSFTHSTTPVFTLVLQAFMRILQLRFVNFVRTDVCCVRTAHMSHALLVDLTQLATFRTSDR